MTEFSFKEKTLETRLTINGIKVTDFKMWAVNLLRREAAGEQIEVIAAESWREVLGYPKDHDAKSAARDLENASR